MVDDNAQTRADGSLRRAFIDSKQASSEDDLNDLLEFPLTDEEGQRIRNRALAAAAKMESEAADTWGRFGDKLDADARMALVRILASAKHLRAMAESLDRKS